jgi:quercetin dioxygenase-like cupin family protein
MGEYREVMDGVRMRLVYCDEGLVAVETVLEEGSVVPRHSHESGQLTILLEGLLLFGIEGKGERVLRPGDYVLVPGGVVHWARALRASVVLDLNWPLTPDRRGLVEKLGGCSAGSR